MKTLKSLKQERGAIFVLTALLLPIMFGCLGIAYDVGNIYIHKARLQNVTDAAALAGGRAYLESQKKATGTKDDVDDESDGHSSDNPFTYTIAGRSNRSVDGITYDSTRKHADADKAADDYIYNNIINLGETVHADKYSHYALRGLKKNAVEEGQESADPTYNNTEATEIFYRVGLYETVPLYFLPVITDKHKEIVRAGSVVLVQPGTTTGNSGGGGTTTITHFPSIFDNLFTYKDSLSLKHSSKLDEDPNNPNNNNYIYAMYVGDIVHSHGEDIDKYYYDQDTNTTPHYYEERGKTVDGKSINDPTIDTMFAVEEYVEALTTAKLSQKYCVLTDQNKQDLYISELNNPNSYWYNEKYFMKDYTGGKAFVTERTPADIFDSGEQGENWWSISYVKVKMSQNSTEYIYVPCVNKNWQGTYYVINKDKKTLDINIESVNGNYFMKLNGQDVYFDKNDNKFKAGNGTVINEDIAALSSNYEQFKYSNIFYINHHNNLNIHIDAELVGQDGGDVNTPIYIIVDPTVQRINIYVTDSNKRPIIFVDTGTDQVQFYNSEREATFSGVLYVPYAEGKGIQLKNKGGFIGNVIAKNIDTEDEDQSSESKIAWIQKNFLENKNYTDSDVALVTEAKKNENANYSFNSLSEEIKNEILTTLEIDADKLGNVEWFQNKSYDEKQSFYGKWLQLYNKYKSNIAVRNLLWPWNDHFNIGGEGGGDNVTTPENLRLINFRTEHRENHDVVDPFIFETLDKPNSY